MALRRQTKPPGIQTTAPIEWLINNRAEVHAILFAADRAILRAQPRHNAEAARLVDAIRHVRDCADRLQDLIGK